MAQEDDLRALGDIPPYQLLLVLLRGISAVALHTWYHQ